VTDTAAHNRYRYRGYHIYMYNLQVLDHRYRSHMCMNLDIDSATQMADRAQSYRPTGIARPGATPELN